MRALVVEDQLKMAALLRRGLIEEGYAVDVVPDGLEAVVRAGATEYDVIVLDVLLPKLDGFEVCRRLREREGVIEVHVLDEGNGFPSGFLGRAFDRFSRAEDARSKGGTGLGLAIAEVIARAHAGQARAANRSDRRGADVWLSIPSAAP